jgi:hypothetical protein
MTSLTLRRASTSRPSGTWSDEDYDVISDRTVVGRIYEDASGSTPPGMRWFWSITEIVPATPDVTNGHAATLDQAKARFRDSWTRTCLLGNAYHEAGHAIVGWALGGRVLEIRIRDDRPGEHARIDRTDGLPLVSRIALRNAGRQSEEEFRHSLPAWSSTKDRECSFKEIVEEGIREIDEIDEVIKKGCARARELLRRHEGAVDRLAARLIECRHMGAEEFERFIEGAGC